MGNNRLRVDTYALESSWRAAHSGIDTLPTGAVATFPTTAQLHNHPTWQKALAYTWLSAQRCWFTPAQYHTPRWALYLHSGPKHLYPETMLKVLWLEGERVIPGPAENMTRCHVRDMAFVPSLDAWAVLLFDAQQDGMQLQLRRFGSRMCLACPTMTFWPERRNPDWNQDRLNNFRILAVHPRQSLVLCGSTDGMIVCFGYGRNELQPRLPHSPPACGWQLLWSIANPRGVSQSITALEAGPYWVRLGEFGVQLWTWAGQMVHHNQKWGSNQQITGLFPTIAFSNGALRHTLRLGAGTNHNEAQRMQGGMWEQVHGNECTLQIDVPSMEMHFPLQQYQSRRGIALTRLHSLKAVRAESTGLFFAYHPQPLCFDASLPIDLVGHPRAITCPNTSVTIGPQQRRAVCTSSDRLAAGRLPLEWRWPPECVWLLLCLFIGHPSFGRQKRTFDAHLLRLIFSF